MLARMPRQSHIGGDPEIPTPKLRSKEFLLISGCVLLGGAIGAALNSGTSFGLRTTCS